jgi:hypothetical protein
MHIVCQFPIVLFIKYLLFILNCISQIQEEYFCDFLNLGVGVLFNPDNPLTDFRNGNTGECRAFTHNSSSKLVVVKPQVKIAFVLRPDSRMQRLPIPGMASPALAAPYFVGGKSRRVATRSHHNVNPRISGSSENNERICRNLQVC